MIIVIATEGTVSLAEWIIDDSCLVIYCALLQSAL